MVRNEPELVDPDEVEGGQDQIETERQALLLLKKLQDLKVWQSRQEERLLEEQKQQILSLEQLGVLQGGESSRYRDDDDTTISSIAYDDDFQEGLSNDLSIDTWADKNDFRPETKELELSNGSLMTVSGDKCDRMLPPDSGSPTPADFNTPTLHASQRDVESDDEVPRDGEAEAGLEVEGRPLHNPDEIPVGGAGRTFAQLLSEKLGGEVTSNERLQDAAPMATTAKSAPPTQQNSGQPRPFLRRGTGLTRFNLPPDPTKQPSRLKRGKGGAGGPDLRNVQSKLSQETVSFASKKSPPRPSRRSIGNNANSGKTGTANNTKLDGTNGVSVTGSRLSPGRGNQPAPRKQYSPPRLKLNRRSGAGGPAGQEATPDEEQTAVGRSPARGRRRSSSPRSHSPLPVPTRMTDPYGSITRLHDSVENSFREKLHVQEKRHEKELKELEVFEMLEDAANDTSFCSTSSRVKTLIDKSILPSPGRPEAASPSRARPGLPLNHPHLAASTPIVNRNSSDVANHQMSTSTPLDPRQKFDPDDPSLGETLMQDIKRFILETGTVHKPPTMEDMEEDEEEDDTVENVTISRVAPNAYQARDDEEAVHDDDDDSTICDDNEQSIGKNWRERMADFDKEIQPIGGNGAGGEMLEFSPPEKIPKHSPSYLIWSIFTKEREEKRLAALQRRKLTSQDEDTRRTNEDAGGVSGRFRSAPPATGKAGGTAHASGGRGAHAQNGKPGRDATSPAHVQKDELDGEANDDLSYQSTLLHMRVVELEQEIETFKKENNKIVSLKKKLSDEKQKITKEWEEFDKMREESKKKLEEERKRLKRDKLLLEKAQRDYQSAVKVCGECEENRNKINKMQEDLANRENRWTAALNKLQEQVNKMEKENKNLHAENQKYRLKNVSSKIGVNAGRRNPASKESPGVKVVSHHRNNSNSRKNNNNNNNQNNNKNAVNSNTNNNNTPTRSEHTIDSGIRTEQGSASSGVICDEDRQRLEEESEDEDQYMDVHLRKSISSTVYAALCGGSGTPADNSPPFPRIVYSPVESMDSSITLVSGVTRSNDSPKSNNTNMPNHQPRIVTNSERGTREKRYPDGRLEVWYSNGNRKEVSKDGKVVKVYYYNGDLKESHSSGLVKYLYSQTQTWHITEPDGREVLQFNNGQEEVRHPDGSMDISFPDGSQKKISKDGSEDIKFPDGTRVQVGANGDRILHLPNGQREEHYKNMKKRIYPDGTTKILHNDGRQETRYANGRVRIKDKNGKLLKDSVQ